MGVWGLGKQEIPPRKMTSHRGKWSLTVENVFPPSEIITHRCHHFPASVWPNFLWFYQHFPEWHRHARVPVQAAAEGMVNNSQRPCQGEVGASDDGNKLTLDWVIQTSNCYFSKQSVALPWQCHMCKFGTVFKSNVSASGAHLNVSVATRTTLYWTA